jgi:hypothetical protein
LLGNILVFAGEVKRGLELLRQTCEQATKNDDRVLLNDVSNFLSRCYAILRDADSAEWWAEQAMDASRQIGTLRHRILAALYYAWASILRGDVLRARSSLEIAQQLASKAGIQIS